MSHIDRLIADPNKSLSRLLFSFTQAKGEDAARLKARICEVMRCQGVTFLHHEDFVYAVVRGDLVASPCLPSHAVWNAVSGVAELTDAMVAHLINACPDDEDCRCGGVCQPTDAEIEAMAFEGAVADVLGDDFTSLLPFRHSDPNAEARERLASNL